MLADLHGASAVRSLALKVPWLARDNLVNILQFIVDNGKEIVAQSGWRDKLKVTGVVFDRDPLLSPGLPRDHGGHVRGHDQTASQEAEGQLGGQEQGYSVRH